jgi:hypothetical protein
MSRLSGLNLRGSFGLLAGRKLSRASHVLNLLRLVSKRFCLPLLIHKILFSDFSYLTFSASASSLKKRNQEKAPHLPSPVAKMKNQATRMRRALATVAMIAVMATNPLHGKKALRRLTFRVEYRRNVRRSWLFVCICVFMKL